MSTAGSTEHADLLKALASQRNFLRRTVQGLTDEQAAERTTVSDLCLGGIIKHVAFTERQWARFIKEGPAAMSYGGDEASASSWLDGFRMLPGETLAGLLEKYDEVAAQTDKQLAGGLDLDATQPLPPAPWFEPGATWTVRYVIMHILAELAQHSGHADIIRESLDGAKTMG
ncbi:MAG TPA: DinB family protein [Streptosporangiaceae bacterium]